MQQIPLSFVLAKSEVLLLVAVKNCFVAFVTLWEVLHLKAFLWSEPLSIERQKGKDCDTATMAKANERTKMKNWIVFWSGFHEKFLNFPFFATENYSRISTLHKIMIIKKGNLEYFLPLSLSLSLSLTRLPMMLLMGFVEKPKISLQLFFPSRLK